MQMYLRGANEDEDTQLLIEIKNCHIESGLRAIPLS